MSDAIRSYRPGEWFGIFGDRATVVLPPSEKARVAGIWALVDAGAGFDEVLDALISGGLRELPGFVLVSDDGTETKVVIRGAARAEFTAGGETVTVEGSSATTWAERSLREVTTMRIDVADSEEAEDLVIPGGLVRMARTDRPPPTSVEPADMPIPVEPGDTTIPPPVEPAETPAPASLTEEAGWAQPSVSPPAAAASPEPPQTAAEKGTSEHDGLTQAGNWTSGAGGGEPGPDPEDRPPEPGAHARPVARLMFSSGEIVEVDRPVVVGRAPEARRLGATDEPRVVTVSSPHQEISSTHLEIRPGAGADHGSAVVTDLGSTNGTVVVQPGLPPEDLQPGIAVQLLPGAIIDLGDGVTIQVGHA